MASLIQRRPFLVSDNLDTLVGFFQTLSSDEERSSFGNHEFTPGRLNLEGRIPVSTSEALRALGHRVALTGDWSNGSAPTVIWVHDGVLNGGADPRRARFVFGR
jgi:gamma-glutamyltranspeptidase